MIASVTPSPDAEPGFARALDTFRRAARYVPAYAEFLAGHGVDPAGVRTPDDFAAVPVVCKENYLYRYPLEMLMWHGEVVGAGTWSSSSGSSGRRSYWPRDAVSGGEGAELYGRILRGSFQIQSRSTLMVVGFAMGDWIGGTYTYSAGVDLRRRGHRLSVVTPGIDAQTILDDIANLGPSYDQVILAGYPPFVKDVLDRAPDRVLKQDLRILVAGENITEEWRDWVLARIGKPDRPDDTCAIYGTADAGIIGHETRATIAARRDPALARALFGASAALPTFVEYDPEYRYTEVDADARLLFTVDTAVPLIRYRINDIGAIIPPAELGQAPAGHRPSTDTCAYLALYGRADGAVSFYAVKIHPDSVRPVFEAGPAAQALTGKFVLAIEPGDGVDQTLCLRVELRPDAVVDEVFGAALRRSVIAELEDANTEYRALRGTLGAAAEPRIALRPYGSAGFEPGIKHRWTERRP